MNVSLDSWIISAVQHWIERLAIILKASESSKSKFYVPFFYLSIMKLGIYLQTQKFILKNKKKKIVKWVKDM